jgi:hypothetical protein
MVLVNSTLPAASFGPRVISSPAVDPFGIRTDAAPAAALDVLCG